MDLLKPMDADGILADRVCEPSEEYELDSDEELLEALGVGPDDNDITTMKHVRSAAERNAERSDYVFDVETASMKRRGNWMQNGTFIRVFIASPGDVRQRLSGQVRKRCRENWRRF